MADTSGVKVIKLTCVSKYERLLNEGSGTCGIRSGHVILKPGENIGEHTTGELEEVLVILKGRGEASINKDTLLEFEDNTVLYIPPKTNHDIKNTGRMALEYIFVTSKV